MGISIIEIALGSPKLDQVLALHKTAKQYLGFLPDEGFKDRAAAGTLLGAFAEDALCGYVLYDLPANRVTIRHLCVDSDWQGTGVARLLLDAVSERHSNRLGIQLECRRDYPANEFWPKVGFRPVGERPGRSLDGLPLTKWLRSHHQPDQTDLFDVLAEERALAALDQMVLEDLVCGKPEGESTQNLLEPWVLDLVELGATDQLFKESNDTSEPTLRNQLISRAKELRYLRSVKPDHDMLKRIALLAPGTGPGDHLHLARAIDAGAEYLLTRDGRLLRARAQVEFEYGIQILRPDQLIAELDRSRRSGLYEPAALQGTELLESRMAATADREFAAALLNSGARERAPEFKARLHAGLSKPDRSEVVQIADRGGKIFAGFVRHRDEGVLRVTLLRVSGRGSAARAVARQLAFAQRAEAAGRELGQVVIEDPHLSPALPAALEAEAYVHDGARWHARVERGINSVVGADRDSAAAIERSCWPGKLSGANLPTYLVAIQPVFAEKLFDSRLAEQTLLHRELGLGLSREHVYYRAPNPGGFISAPARILWYVSGGRPGHPDGELRAVSHLAEVVIDSPTVLCRRFERLGAWTYEQVSEAADRKGQAMALRIVDTELFNDPLDLEALRDAYKEIGTTFRPPFSPIKVDESVFELLYRRSSAYVD
jgi:ribosomal protein S18 acetylase RimI-like enzyme/predicted nucleic acid-binding protein